MALRLQIVSRHQQSLAERSFKEFDQTGGTIGRSLESDWVLPDGQRFLSSRHASIDFRSGSYYVIDTSTNGVYINGADQPVGRGKPQRLFSGDRMRIGEYEMLVEIDEIDSTREQMADMGHVDPVDRKQRVDALDPTAENLIDPFHVTGVGIEIVLDGDQAATLSPLGYKFKTEDKFKANELRLEEDVAAPPAVGAASAPVGAAFSRDSAIAPSARKKESRPEAAPTTTGGTGAALDAFFRGAGMEPRALDARQTEELLHRLGQLMRETVVGLTESMHLRTAQKTALRQSNTTIQPRENNSLKFSAGVDEALGNLFFRESEQYMNAVESVRDAFGDLKVHQQALLKAMTTAIGDYIGRLDPEDLEQKFSNGRHGVLMGAANKFKYWDLYKDLYQVVAQQSPGELPQLFLEEVSRAYEQATSRAAAPRHAQNLKAGNG